MPSWLLPSIRDFSRVERIDFVVAGELTRLARDEEGRWRRATEDDATFSSQIEEKLSLLGRARFERIVGTRVSEGATHMRYGLKEPEIAISFFTSSSLASPAATIEVGAEAPDHLSVYVDVDPGPGIVTVPRYQVRNLRDLVCYAADSKAC